MRRKASRWLPAIVWIAATAGAAPAKMIFYGGNHQYQVQNALQTPRTAGQDNWAWRDAVENTLVNFGPAVVPYLEAQLPQRDGYEADAIQVALFRLNNNGLNPASELGDWGRTYFHLEETETLRIERVLDSRGGPDLRSLFPHHLFYVLIAGGSQPSRRVVVALASDGKVQALQDDGALAAFLHAEAEPQLNVFDRTRLTSAAALLAISRNVTTYRPQFRPESNSSEGLTYQSALSAETSRAQVNVTFDVRGRVESCTTGATSTPAVPRPAIVPPTKLASPPAMPE